MHMEGEREGNQLLTKLEKKLSQNLRVGYYPKETLTLRVECISDNTPRPKASSLYSTTNDNHTHKKEQKRVGMQRAEGKWFVTCSSCLALATRSASSSANFSSDIYSLNIISLSSCLTDLYLGSFLRLSFTYQNQELCTSIYIFFKME